jgi:hypothetical protein
LHPIDRANSCASLFRMSMTNAIQQRMQRQAAVADYISQCDDVLQAELERRDGQYPDWLILPYAQKSSGARFALAHWLDEVRERSGKTIRIYFEDSGAAHGQLDFFSAA